MYPCHMQLQEVFQFEGFLACGALERALVIMRLDVHYQIPLHVELAPAYIATERASVVERQSDCLMQVLRVVLCVGEGVRDEQAARCEGAPAHAAVEVRGGHLAAVAVLLHVICLVALVRELLIAEVALDQLFALSLELTNSLRILIA